MQGGGEGLHQGNPMPIEPTNKTKTPHLTDDSRQSPAARAARAQPPDSDQCEVQPLMEEGQQDEWKRSEEKR